MSSPSIHLDFKIYPEMNKELPIGIFDSGTGGLTVLEALVTYNKFQNKSQKKGRDKVSDFDLRNSSI